MTPMGATSNLKLVFQEPYRYSFEWFWYSKIILVDQPTRSKKNYNNYIIIMILTWKGNHLVNVKW